MEVDNELVNTLLQKLIACEREDKGPFPYDDIRWLMTRAPISEEFIPDLDYYYSNVIGYVSWGPKILNWSPEKISQVTTYLSAGFFEKHPQYSSLHNWITEAEAPRLYRLLERTEFMRITLLSLLEHIKSRGND